MSSPHLTPIARSRREGTLIAQCPEHGRIGFVQPDSRHGLNAVITEARAHDDMAHRAKRSVAQYRQAIGLP